MTRTLEFRALHGDVTDAQIHRRRCRQLLAVGCSCPGNGPAALAPIPGRFRQRPCPLRRRSHREHGVLRRRFYPLVRVALNYCCRLSGYTATHNTLSDDRDFSLLPDRKQSSSCLCSARMNAWLLFLPGRPATSIERLHLLQVFWSAHEAPFVVLAIDRRERYCFLNSAIDSSVTRKALEVWLALSHSNSTNRRTDLVLQSSWRAASAMVLEPSFARARSSRAKRWNASYDTSNPATVPSMLPTTGNFLDNRARTMLALASTDPHRPRTAIAKRTYLGENRSARFTGGARSMTASRCT